ncbi:heavy metal translocating P-type ATPase [Azotosporobacter soli]|uniref:heavy metal translocating P-type ATPase n=1 Tax=Azotosporobacter soli TaxID=3055040 RepID=UPI0031FE60C6
MQNKKRLMRVLGGGALYAATFFFDFDNEILNIAMFLLGYFIIGGDIVWKAVKNILRGQVFDENFLMFIATIGAFAIGDYEEAVGVMLFFQVGELFQSYAVDQSRKSIAGLMDIRPDYANLRRGSEIVKVDPDEVMVGDEIIVKTGEKIPLDAIVIEGESMVDTSSLTGESVPREVTVGSELLSGCVNINGVLTARVTKEFGDSTVSKILDLVENASNKKSNSENFITKFARYYTPGVVILAVLLAVVPPLMYSDQEFTKWLVRALTFLVISCPCALVISIPLSFFGGIGGASKLGVLVKGSNYLEALAQTEIVVFDKTGTLTKGVFNVQEIHSEVMSREELIELTAYAENYSNHPISLSLKRAYGKAIDNAAITNVKELPGHGVQAFVHGKEVLAGNYKLMKKMKIAYFKGEIMGTVVHVAVGGEYVGYIVIADEIKNDAAIAIQDLKTEKVKQTVMLTGDSKSIGEHVAKKLGLDKAYTELLPADKVEKLEELFAKKTEKGKLVFVGDGVNDAPVLARADIGIAMGGVGSDAAIEAADVVIMTDEPSKIATAIRASKKTLSIVKQNIVFALGVKGIVLVLGAMGIANMWTAVFADVGVSVIAILNAMRVLNTQSIHNSTVPAWEGNVEALSNA